MRKIRLQSTKEQEQTVPASVLVIDDSPTVCKIIEMTLSRAGYQVHTFQDGVAALTWLASLETVLPHLLFLDIQMPKLSGYQIARHLKSKPEFVGVNIVLMSRCDGAVDRLKARLCGGNEYVIKPFPASQLLSVAQRYLRPASESQSKEGASE